MADQSTCLSPACGVTVDGSFKQCPQCGWAMRGPRNFRVRGWVLVVLGLFLVIFMGAIAWNVAPSMLYPGEEKGGMTFTGTSGDAEFALMIFGFVILFGLLSFAHGVWMIAKGRPNRIFTIITMGVATVVFAFGWAVRRKII